ncbi:hypothetical protein SPRG_16751 [Saprolegnia parasitica CBS 223.65]|uniref:Uncharacterized protein n=1 Tax=Saprolegnia parasitica (strain CBS 223.65) TaxID=695850 RepID=A0A067BI17_SAPPC|nr:hypothetical protein SPRG_16751 [Saprolegnia parasitica CBS 223.65]KDO17793.1 hypothetical protein SPRG_16751 [Saprolegnia parasitica CBS 223.65]|eukprot:XP_012211498.1 hypothetical protein SPRG_16751 [Saprolegnia parasitica CBS 223.65]
MTLRAEIIFETVLVRIEKQVELPVAPPLSTSPKQYQDALDLAYVFDVSACIDVPFA